MQPAYDLAYTKADLCRPNLTLPRILKYQAKLFKFYIVESYALNYLFLYYSNDKNVIEISQYYSYILAHQINVRLSMVGRLIK